MRDAVLLCAWLLGALGAFSGLSAFSKECAVSKVHANVSWQAAKVAVAVMWPVLIVPKITFDAIAPDQHYSCKKRESMEAK